MSLRRLSKPCGHACAAQQWSYATLRATNHTIPTKKPASHIVPSNRRGGRTHRNRSSRGCPSFVCGISAKSNDAARLPASGQPGLTRFTSSFLTRVIWPEMVAGGGTNDSSLPNASNSRGVALCCAVPVSSVFAPVGLKAPSGHRRHRNDAARGGTCRLRLVEQGAMAVAAPRPPSPATLLGLTIST